jgi:hypothetical protein
MTDLAQTPQVTELPSPGAEYLPAAQHSQPDAHSPGRSSGDVVRLIALSVGGIAGGAAIVWFIFFGPGETGSKAQWFFGAVVFVAVMVSLWQTHSILRRGRLDAADAENRLRRELAAAHERSSRELALVRSIHEAEMDAQRELARAELTAQAELARVERVQLLAQQQKLAMNEVTRAVNAQTHALATLWNHGATVLAMADREAREHAMNPIFEQIGQVVNDFSVELANAHLLVDDDRVHRALDRVNEAVLTAMHVAEDVHLAVVEGEAPQATAMSGAQRLVHERAAEARHLAWNLLRAGVDDSSV